MNIEGAARRSGGASGLGAATVRRLHAAGAKVVIADVNPERASRSPRSSASPFVQCDVREEEQVQAAVDKAAAGRGRAAHRGLLRRHRASRSRSRRAAGPHPLDAFKVILDINLVGTFNLMRLAAFKMLSDNEPNAGGERGVLVNTASVAAFEGQIGQIAYSASKGGVVGMTLTAARDLADKGIRVCTIAPGLFDTPLLGALPEDQRAALGAQVPFPSRLGTPEEFASLAAHIVENPMLNGETIRLDGAIRMAPK